jgi:hypothetical protein
LIGFFGAFDSAPGIFDFEFRCRLAGKFRLINPLRVAGRLGQRLVPKEAHYLMRCGSALREAYASGLPQSVCAETRRELSVTATLPKPIAKACRTEWGTSIGRQESKMPWRGDCFECDAKLGKYRNSQLDLCLLLPHAEKAIANVLEPHADNIAAPLRGAE